MKLIHAVILLAAPAPVLAQTAEEQIVGAAEALFDAMERKDETAIREVMLPDAQLTAVASTERGTSTAWTSVDEFVDAIIHRNEDLLERLWNPDVRVDGDIATLWVDYDFHRDGQFSHCGVDAFHMVRTGGAWKIAHITYNLRREGCYSPLIPPAGRRQP
jgi:hypothetical protein